MCHMASTAVAAWISAKAHDHYVAAKLADGLRPGDPEPQD
jgi:hypothetical protein